MEDYVLLVDDEPSVTLLYSMMLGKYHNLKSQIAKDRASAMHIFNQRVPLAIISDNNMPAENEGLEMLAEIRKAHPALPFIIGSGTWSDHQRRKAVELKATEVYDKGSFPAKDLCARVAHYIRNGASV